LPDKLRRLRRRCDNGKSVDIIIIMINKIVCTKSGSNW